ncbi:MAG: hypothetical protein DCC75_04880 [Proteobacteria bacterium]|nr:MAG: hypothetical protein DCC75_04880 [Pseudomonadota bacterium]
MLFEIYTGLLVAGFLLIILILSLYARHLATRDLRLLTDVARKYGGKVSMNSFNSSAVIDFTYRPRTISGKPTRTCMRCNLDYGAFLSIYIAQEATNVPSAAELRQLILCPKVTAGSQEFHRSFELRGNNQSFLRALVAGDFERQLLSLRAEDPVLVLHPKNQALAGINSKEARQHLLEFSVQQAPRQSSELEKLIDGGLMLMRPLIAANI